MAKKKSGSNRRRQTPAGVDPNEKRRERLEARRQAKAEALRAKQRAEQRARAIRIAMWIGLLALAVWFVFVRNANNAPSEINGHEVKSFSTAGEGDHSPPFEYETSPPVAGAHSTVIACGTYGEPVPNENLVHTLEHGAVYALYSPDLAVDQIRTLETLAQDEGWTKNFLVAPYDGEMPDDALVSIGSWGHRMDLEEVDRDAIVEYYDELNGKGTAEAGIGCPNDEDETFEPEDAAGTDATPSPSPEETPSPKASSSKK